MFNGDLSGESPAGYDPAGGIPVTELRDHLSREIGAGSLQPLHLPPKFQAVSPEQYEAISNILYLFHDSKVVVLDAPTGSGKTVIAEIVRQLLGLRGLYVCHSLSLQDQFARDFPEAGVIKGRSNYLPMRKVPGVTCADCNKIGDVCSWCPDDTSLCEYEHAKNRALHSMLGVLNSTYFLTECNGPGRFSKRPFAILDEADTLEQELMRFVEVRITPAMQRRLQLSPPTKVTKEESWNDWVDQSLASVGRQRIILEPDEQDVQLIRRAKYLENLYRRLQLLSEGLANKDWIYTGGKTREDISFKPVVVDRLGREFIWGHAGKFLVMSATVISSAQLLDELGYEGDFGTVLMDSTFDVKNRQVRVCPVANMSRSSNERDELIQALVSILGHHSGERALLHTVSYDLASYVTAALRSVPGLRHRKIISYSKANEREAAIASLRKTDAAILVSPSLDRGYDFTDDDCRVNIICKVPFPYLGDKQVSKRLYSPGGQQWYNIQTVRSIVQMTGRGTRHKDDYSTNYILDKQFGSLWNKCRNLFPKWWTEALDWRYRLV